MNLTKTLAVAVLLGSPINCLTACQSEPQQIQDNMHTQLTQQSLSGWRPRQQATPPAIEPQAQVPGSDTTIDELASQDWFRFWNLFRSDFGLWQQPQWEQESLLKQQRSSQSAALSSGETMVHGETLIQGDGLAQGARGLKVENQLRVTPALNQPTALNQIEGSEFPNVVLGQPSELQRSSGQEAAKALTQTVHPQTAHSLTRRPHALEVPAVELPTTTVEPSLSIEQSPAAAQLGHANATQSLALEPLTAPPALTTSREFQSFNQQSTLAKPMIAPAVVAAETYQRTPATTGDLAETHQSTISTESSTGSVAAAVDTRQRADFPEGAATGVRQRSTAAALVTSTGMYRQAAGWWAMLPWLLMSMVGWVIWRQFEGEDHVEDSSGKANFQSSNASQANRPTEQSTQQQPGTATATVAPPRRSTRQKTDVDSSTDFEEVRDQNTDNFFENDDYDYLEVNEFENSERETVEYRSADRSSAKQASSCSNFSDSSEAKQTESIKFNPDDRSVEAAGHEDRNDRAVADIRHTSEKTQSRDGVVRYEDGKYESHDSTEHVVNANANAKSQRSIAASTSQPAETRDDLTRIKGIGPATARLLRKANIQSFQDLYECDSEKLRRIVSANRSNFDLGQVGLWTQQAKYAMDGDWAGIKEFQLKNCLDFEDVSDRAKNELRNQRESKPTESKSSAPDDLTLIRGIGPAVQQVLQDKDVTQFDQISEMTSQGLKDLFRGQESRFQLIDPASWIAQAKHICSRRLESVEAISEESLLQEIKEISDIAAENLKSTKATSVTSSRR